ncbi:DsbA family protein [Qipengyuania gaetbuli]|uniref:Thioredoxin domain-containing protein n=1 Tax=Qipengyuania gaetbuli TaxID=266952 RepID=A0A844Y1I2_9SPHN|nr:DsbA family protein [Qipengyuania gaetbuli]MBY6015213.1 DsbA family protein [Qipengyuania gaetbuli]MXO51844.1 thioredoxin domain-containing protein [Qipengyuania gaetbuli]
MKQHLATAAIALVGGFAGAAIWSFTGLGHSQTRDYLVSNPGILPEMADAWQAEQSREQLAQVADEVRKPFPGAVLGNPNGTRTLVKFTDYACGYCRISVADVDRLIQENPDVRVVIREFPIFQGSDVPARMALAAAKQGKYKAFHHAMFELGSPTAENVMLAAQQAGLDLDAAREYGASEEVTAELARNQELARSLGFTGTPSWVAGDKVMEGAIGFDRLEAALGS